MRRLILAPAAAAAASLAAVALAAAPPTATPCKQAGYECLPHPVTIRLRLADGSTHSHTYPAPVPIVEKGTLMVLPGETLYLEAVIEKDRIVRFRLVPPKAKHPKHTVSLQFVQGPVRGHREGMILRVDNPFKRSFKYHAQYQLPGAESGKFYKAGTCPVPPGKQAVELWTYALARLRLSDFHFVAPAKGARKCGY